ncbi:MAG: IS66 family transposase [Acidobacteria bacterium]|nr:IS66 family transposase [Acidobacteriota bacterium]
MDDGIGKDARIRMLVAAALEGQLTESQAQELARCGRPLLEVVLLAAAHRIAELKAKIEPSSRIDPSTPSGQRPVYTKPPAPRREGKPGAKPGHVGSRRPAPPRIDRREEHRAEVCPDCGGELQRCKRKRTRTVEDVLADLRTEVTEHTVHRDYCPACKKHVEPTVPDALPNATIGHNLAALTGWLHYGVGVTSRQVLDLVGIHLHTRLSAGGLISMWHRLGEVLGPWYQQIAEAARASAVLWADETGWRRNGLTCWLWCFASKDVCYYLIDRSRGGPALAKFFTEAFDGVLVHDFWAAYDAIEAQDHQCCLAHLLRELEKVDLTNGSAAWKAFAKKLRRLLRDGIRLRKRVDFDPKRYGQLIRRIDRRLMELARGTYGEADADRLAKRLLRHCDSLFTFLDHPEVPYENNHAERMIRPAVIIRKNSQSNRSDKGAMTQALLMSVYRTLKLRGQDPVQTVAAALRTYTATGHLPPLPVQFVADG